MAVIQYSDTPRLEIPLGEHQGGAQLIQAIQGITYLGGNTQVGQRFLYSCIQVLSEYITPLCVLIIYDQQNMNYFFMQIQVHPTIRECSITKASFFFLHILQLFQ